MRLILILMVLIATTTAQADSGWFCAHETSKLEGDDLKACGTGTGASEMIARKDAFYEAHLEFWHLCQLSDNCRGYPVSIIPGRTVCAEKKSPPTGYTEYFRWRCERMLTFIVDRSNRPCEPNGRERFKGCKMNDMPDRPWQ